jgi:hypothetical protein
MVNPKKIVLYGHSLGACVTAYLMNHLVQNDKVYADRMIIQNAFENIQRVCNDMVPFFGKFIVSDMKTDKYIKNIDSLKDNIEICIIHSKDDKLIHSNHSVNLSKYVKNNKLKFIMLEGTHDNPMHDETFDRYLNETCKNK